jgi:lactate dehydrogenase-like 2-hydroxyacid dehydrogenase
MARIVITRPLPAEEVKPLDEAHDVRILDIGPDNGGDEDRMVEAVADADALITLLDNPVTARVLAASPNLRVVAQCAVGYDNIDLEAAAELQIAVTHTPGVLTDATADQTMALMLAAARRLREADRYLRDGRFKRWEMLELLGLGLAGKTLGIVGLGRIGSAVARRALGFGMRIIYHDRKPINPTIERMAGAHRVDLDTLLAESDVVSLHCPLNAESHHMIDAAALSRMKPLSILVNTARGPIVDEAALVDALRSGRIAAAGLDVFEDEPRIHPGLFELDNVVMTPHLGSATRLTRRAMARMCVEAVEAALAGEEIPYRIA